MGNGAGRARDEAVKKVGLFILYTAALFLSRFFLFVFYLFFLFTFVGDCFGFLLCCTLLNVPLR